MGGGYNYRVTIRPGINHGTYSLHTVFSPAHTRHVGPTSLQYRLSLMWEWEECNSFDVASGSTQISPSSHALKSAWGEHCYTYSLHLLVPLAVQFSEVWNLLHSCICRRCSCCRRGYNILSS